MPGTPAISVIIPVRNRAGARLENCLRSLRGQRLEPHIAEVVISDFGSDPASLADVRRLAERFDARVVETATEEVWNRSRALNHGIQAARGEFIFCTDADMIFAPNFLQVAIDAQRDAGGEALVVCRCRDLPGSVPEQPRETSAFPALLEQSSYREALGTGACQIARRTFFEAVRGYDERFVFWGMEDNDMLFRARATGLEVLWIHEQTAMLHQWHPSSRGARPLRKFLNDARFHLTKWIRVKNWSGWGSRPHLLRRGA